MQKMEMPLIGHGTGRNVSLTVRPQLTYFWKGARTVATETADMRLIDAKSHQILVDLRSVEPSSKGCICEGEPNFTCEHCCTLR